MAIWTSDNLNFGISTSSRIEFAHHEFKSYIENPNYDLFELYSRMELLFIVKYERYIARMIREATIHKDSY